MLSSPFSIPHCLFLLQLITCGDSAENTVTESSVDKTNNYIKVEIIFLVTS